MNRVTRPAAAPTALALALVLPIVAGGCALGGSNKVAPRLYDFGVAARSAAEIPPVSLGSVSAAPGLSGTEIRYRLASDPFQARAYGESRWLAAPAELLGELLHGTLAGSGGKQSGPFGPLAPAALRLTVQLVTFEQVFDGPSSARAVVRLVAEVQDARTRRTLGRRVIAAERPTPTADAAGAVATLVVLAEEAVAELASWIATEVELPAAPEADTPVSEPPGR